MTKINEALLGDEFMQPAVGILHDYVRGARTDGALDDESFLRLGLRRALDGDESGRAFVQARADGGDALACSTWFDALHSPRRLSVLGQIAAASYTAMEATLHGRDWLGAFPELAQRAAWAVDGHNIEHACHARRDGKGARVPVGVSYGLCLHSGLMRPLGCYQGDGRHGHEWPLFKKRWDQWLRLDQRPCLPIIVADPAYVDILFWAQKKIDRQAVVITREKENMKPEVIGALSFDPNDPVNRGVISDEYAGYSYAYWRRIRYRDPATGEEFVFITTDTSLRPGLVALLYLLRWKIEKSYDVFKNKFRVKKAWGNGEVTAMLQGHFMALLHNLLTILLCALEKAGIKEDKVLAKRKKRLARQPKRKRVPSHAMIRHASCLTCQFIRLLRHCIRHKVDWGEALPLFKTRLSVYL